MGYSKKDYRLVKFEKAKAKGKKYTAIIENKDNGKQRKINFGALGMEHYKDSTGLGLYSKSNHNDKLRLKAFRDRFRHQYNPNEFSPLYFSWKYLW